MFSLLKAMHHPYCNGEFFNGTRIFDSILRIKGTVYSTLKRMNVDKQYSRQYFNRTDFSAQPGFPQALVRICLRC